MQAPEVNMQTASSSQSMGEQEATFHFLTSNFNSFGSNGVISLIFNGENSLGTQNHTAQHMNHKDPGAAVQNCL